jgi:hypothetical protein
MFRRHVADLGLCLKDELATRRATVTKDRATVQLEGELCFADVSVVTLPAPRATQEFCDQIAYILLELMDEQPDVLELLSGRTFARTFH